MDIENLFQKAVQAGDSGNFDYAVEILQQVILFQPDHARARRKLHSVALKRATRFPVGKGKIFFSGGIVLLSAKIMKSFKKYEQAVSKFEKYLLLDPSNISVMLDLAECCALCNYSESAVDIYEYVRELEPKNPVALKALGNIYSEMKEIKKALDCYDLLVKVAPADADASKKLRDLSAMDMMDKKYTGADYRAVIKDERKAEALQVSDKLIRTDDDLDKALEFALEELESNPEETRFLLKVSDLYRRKGQFDKARQQLDKAIELNPTDPTIRMKLGDLEIFRMENEIKALRKEQVATGSTQLSEKIERLTQELRQFMLTEYEARVESHPTDMNFRFTFGSLLFETKQYDRAISEFQQSRRDPQYRAQSLTMLGRCFLERDMPDLAIKQFNEGLKNLEVMDDKRKDLLYYLADAYMRSGDRAEALKLLQEILEVDIRFRDVAQKVKDLRAS